MTLIRTPGCYQRAHRYPLCVKALLVVFVLVALPACGSAFDAERDTAAGIESKVWSPYCPGRLLADCPTTQSRELREEIAERVDRGETEAEVLAWVKGEFGETSVAEPDASPGGLLIWLVPAAIFVVGALLVVRRARARPSRA